MLVLNADYEDLGWGTSLSCFKHPVFLLHWMDILQNYLYDFANFPMDAIGCLSGVGKEERWAGFWQADQKN